MSVKNELNIVYSLASVSPVICNFYFQNKHRSAVQFSYWQCNYIQNWCYCDANHYSNNTSILRNNERDTIRLVSLVIELFIM